MPPLEKNEIKTDLGHFHRDPSGVWHYECQCQESEMRVIAEDALKHHPGIGLAAYFWFKGAFCPIVRKEDWSALSNRWGKWNCTLRKKPKMVKMMEEFSHEDL